MTSLTSLLTGVGPTNTYEMFMRLVLAGQMKIVAATSARVLYNNGQPTALSSITIPTLTGSQVAIVYCEITLRTATFGSTACQGYMTATGTGISVGVDNGYPFPPAANYLLPPGQSAINSSFGATTTGNNVITVSAQLPINTTTEKMTAQATIFIYSPPF